MKIKIKNIEFNVRFVLTSLVLIFILVISNELKAQTATYTTAGANTWTCPTNVTSATIECWGGGGAGGGNSTTADGGGGGGGGAYSKSTLTVVPSTIYNLNVGNGGAGVVGADGNPGGDSWFNTSLILLAKGGTAGKAPVAGAAGIAGLGGTMAASIGTVKYSGGDGGLGRDNNTGRGGSGGTSAGTGANGNPGLADSQVDVVAPAGGGNGGAGGLANNNGVNGYNPGGAGGGSGDDAGAGARKGGDGAVGKIIITWPTLTIGNNTIVAANVCPNAVGVQLHGFTLTGTSGGGTVTGLTFVTNGTYTASNISNFKLYYTTTSTFATTNLLATVSTPTSAGTQTFPSFSCPVGTATIWFWITMDLYDATAGNTIFVSGTQVSNITETGAELLGGPSTASGTQTFLSTAVGNAGTISATPGSMYICAGQSGVGPYSVTAITGATGYTWTLPTGASIATGANTNSITVDYSGGAVSGNITVQGTDGGCPGRISPNLTIGIMNIPTIITNPVSKYGCNGTPVTFSVVATGAGLTYQWQENGVNLSNGGVYSGVTTTTLTISDPSGLNGRTYRCVVTGQCTPSVTSTSATLNVLGNGLSGTKNIPGDYATLEAAFTDINNKGLIGNLYLRIGANITETGAATLNQWNNCGNSGYTVTVYPTGATRTISGSIATSLIILNGADYVTFDGRIDMTGAPNSLILSNTNTSGSAIKFISDACYNTVKYTTLQGVSNTSTTGVVWFSTGATTGNDNNTITYCDIRDGASFPKYGIYALGTSDAIANKNNSITYCNIYNQGVATTGSCMGIIFENYCSKWTISNNSFYLETARTDLSYFPIYLSSPSGDGFIINYNKIGGRMPNCGGSALTLSYATIVIQFYAIYTNFSTSGVSYISNNTIKNISYTGATHPTAYTFAAVAALGRVDVANNVVGDNSTGSISITINDNGTNAAALCGYYKLGNGALENNSIGSITIAGNTNDLGSFQGILVTGTITTDVIINNNIIGSSSTLNSISTNAGATPALDLTGIMFGTGGSFTSTVSNNIIANISNNCTASTHSTFGISNVATGGVQRVIGNQIFNLSSTGTSTYTNTWPVLAGIKNNNTTTGDFEISSNKIHSLSATGSAAVNLHGILLNNAATGTNVVSRNFIHSLYTSSTTAEQNGIFLFTGTATLRNNMIRLGIDKDGNSVTTSALIRGIYKATSSNTNIYYNSIYIGGAGVASGTVNTYALSRTATATDNIINNILFNARSNSSGTGKHYSIFINATTTLTSNYNNLYTTGTGGCISNAGGGCTFANWQALGFDASGRNLDPSFTNSTGNSSAVDLHLSSDASPMIDKGFYLPSVLVDYDGQQRKIGPTPPNNDGNDPCIGADERIVPPSAQSAYGIFMPDSQGGTIADCEIFATGGVPGGGGYSVHANGATTNYANVNISTYQIITQQNIQCTNTNINFTTADPTPDWLLGNGSNPNSGSTTPITTQYSSTGRKDIIESIKVFKDFTNITMATPSSGSILGAPAAAGCPTTYTYASSVAGSAGFTYSWSASTPGGCSAIIQSPTSSTTDITFINTTGYNQIFTLYLNITSECCGPLTQVVRYITIWPAPLAPNVVNATPSSCTGGQVTLSISSPNGSYSYDWYDASTGGTLLGSGTDYLISSAISGATNYYVQATNSYGCTSSRTTISVTGIDTPPPTVTSPVQVCGSNDANLNITAPTAGYTYSWYSGSCGGTLLQTGTSSIYTTVVAADITIYVNNTPPGCSPSTCSSILLDYFDPPNPITWLGATAGTNNWFELTNWTSGCLPTCETNVTIPNLAIDPDIGYNVNNNAATKDIILQAGAELSFSDSRAILDICGDFTQTGIVTTNNLGKIVFNGSASQQNYSKTGSGNLNNVRVNNTFTTPVVNLSNSDITLGASGVLTLSNGIITTGSYNVIVLNPNASAINSHSTLSYINGNLRRYISGAGSFDFPVGNSSSYQLLNMEISSISGLNYINANFTNPADFYGTGLPVTETCWALSTVINNGAPGGNGGVWNLTPDAGSANYNLTLFGRNYNNQQLCHTIMSRANPATAWGFAGTTYDSQSIAGGVITVKRNNFTGFSQKAIIGSSALLPIDLISFKAVCENNRIKILWETATEVNSDYYVIEYSSDGHNFIPLAIVDSKGYSNEVVSYSYIDEVNIHNVGFYKLKHVDVDGNYTYSDVIYVDCNVRDEQINIYYLEEQINISFANLEREAVTLNIYDNIGRVISRELIKIDSQNYIYTVNKNSLGLGVYNFVFLTNNKIIPKQIVIYNK